MGQRAEPTWMPRSLERKGPCDRRLWERCSEKTWTRTSQMDRKQMMQPPNGKQCHQIRQQWGPLSRRIVWYPRKDNQHVCQLSSIYVEKRTHMKKKRNNWGIKEHSKDCGWNAHDPRSSQQPAVFVTVIAAPICDNVLLSVALSYVTGPQTLSSLRLPGPAGRDTQK